MVVPDRDEYEPAFGDLLFSASIQSFDMGVDMHGDAGAADLLDLCVAKYAVTHVDRSMKDHAIQRYGRQAMTGEPPGTDPGRKIHLAQQPAAEDIAG